MGVSSNISFLHCIFGEHSVKKKYFSLGVCPPKKYFFSSLFSSWTFHEKQQHHKFAARRYFSLSFDGSFDGLPLTAILKTMPMFPIHLFFFGLFLFQIEM